jgi:hypothetical protein
MFEELTGTNRETVREIIVQDLKKKKVCACFVPHLLTPDQKHRRAASSVEFVEMIGGDRNVLKRIVTGDESWCFMYDPETKRQSATWLSPKKPKAQKVRMQKLCVKKKCLLHFLMLKISFIMNLCRKNRQSINFVKR